MKLITTIEEIQESLPVTFNSAIDRVKPFIGAAERNYLIAVIGKAQYEVFVAAYTEANYNTADILDPEIKEAVIICQRIISNLGYLTGIPVLNVNFTDAGISVTSTESIKQAFKWQVDDVKAAIQELGFTAIEELLIFMEEDSPDKFPEYLNSVNFIRHHEYLITSASDFSDNFNISNSRYIFKTLSYLMRRVEEQSIKKVFGSEFFEALKSDDLNAKQRQLMTNYIMPGIALLTGAKGVVERVITFRNGVASVNLEGNYDSEKGNAVASRDQINMVCEQLITDGTAFLQDGLQFIMDNLEDFPNYQRLAPKRRRNITNNKENGIFAV